MNVFSLLMQYHLNAVGEITELISKDREGEENE